MITSYKTITSGRDFTNGKINALKEYMFSITIENSKRDYYFTE